jgi:hypothetical protein
VAVRKAARLFPYGHALRFAQFAANCIVQRRPIIDTFSHRAQRSTHDEDVRFPDRPEIGTRSPRYFRNSSTIWPINATDRRRAHPPIATTSVPYTSRFTDENVFSKHPLENSDVPASH